MEIEWKFSASPEALAAMEAAFPGPWEQIEMRTVYFDTAEGALAGRKRTLRVRWENGAAVSTYKTPDLGMGRGEWEAPGDDPKAALAAAGAQVPGPLVPVCGARFLRKRLLVPTDDGWAELALDEGALTAGDRETPLLEAEIELKSGSRGAAEALARAIAAKFDLAEEPRSKFRRALDLAGGWTWKNC